MVVYPPGLPHEEWADPLDPQETIFLAVSAPAEYPRGVHLMLPDRGGSMRWLVQSTLSEHQLFGCSPLAHTYVQALLQLVERSWQETASVSHDFVDATIQYIQMHYALPLSVPTLADVAHVSSSYLAKRFRERTGISLMRYVQDVRMREAVRLVVTTDEPVAQIAREVGFTDPLYFSRVFRRVTGHSPTAMRKMPGGYVG